MASDSKTGNKKRAKRLRVKSKGAHNGKKESDEQSTQIVYIPPARIEEADPDKDLPVEHGGIIADLIEIEKKRIDAEIEMKKKLVDTHLRIEEKTADSELKIREKTVDAKIEKMRERDAHGRLVLLALLVLFAIGYILAVWNDAIRGSLSLRAYLIWTSLLLVTIVGRDVWRKKRRQEGNGNSDSDRQEESRECGNDREDGDEREE